MHWNFIGNSWAIDLLKNHIQKESVRHAYLFSGPRGVGKRTLALRFIQALNCEAPPRPGEFCDQCRPCNLIPEGEYPDLHIVQTGEHDRSIKVDQIRELQRSLSLSPYEGRWRVALIVRFQEATEQAANALLKTLEEPPPHVILLLTSDSFESLLPTIVSRCELVGLRASAIGDLGNDLKDRAVERDRTELLAGLSGGRPGVALRMAMDPEVLDRRMRWLDELQRVLSCGIVDRFAIIEEWDARLRKRHAHLDDRRNESIDILETWLSFWRDVMLQSYDAEAPLSNPDHQEEIEVLAGKVSSGEAREAVAVIESIIRVIGQNANLRLALETLMLDLPQPGLDL